MGHKPAEKSARKLPAKSARKPAEKSARKLARNPTRKSTQKPAEKNTPIKHHSEGPGPKRTRCSYCGCEWLNIPYTEQLTKKNEQMRELFTKFITPNETGHAARLYPIIGMQTNTQATQQIQPAHFRHKAATPFAPRAKQKRTSHAQQNEILCGFFAPGTHRIIRCTECPSELPEMRDIFNFIAKTAGLLGISAYDEDTQTGLLRHAIVRFSKYRDEAMLVLVTHSAFIPQRKRLVKKILERFACITTIVQNVNPRNTNAMLGSYSKVLCGSGAIRDELLGCQFEIGPTSFYQTNPEQTEVLYQVALDGIREVCAKQLRSGEPLRILDAYCGCGTIGICAAAAFSNAYVTGVDQTENAIESARKNKRLNHLKNRCGFICQDATEFMQNLVYADGAMQRNAASETALSGNEPEGRFHAGRFHAGRFHAVIIDPPRAGSTPAFIEGVCALNPQCIVYISCNPNTQVRDLLLFAEKGYTPQRIQPVDMFPHTSHVETVVLMSRAD